MSDRELPARRRGASSPNVQLRANLRSATDTIRAKRARVVGELPDWEELRDAGRAIKADVLAHLDEYLVQFEAAVTAAGGQRALGLATRPRRTRSSSRSRGRTASTEVVKVKSLTTDEIQPERRARRRRASTRSRPTSPS